MALPSLNDVVTGAVGCHVPRVFVYPNYGHCLLDRGILDSLCSVWARGRLRAPHRFTGGEGPRELEER